MNIIKTSILLITTLILVPLSVYFYGTPIGEEEKDILYELIQSMVVVALICFIVGELTNNNSQVDKLWSILPIFYIWYVAYKSGFDDRLVLMSALATIWGIRLTWNFSLKGAYRLKFWEGEEDYRWAILRAKPEFQSKWKWKLFHLFFICLYQNALILMFTMPSLVAYQFKGEPLNILDFCVGFLMLFFILYEGIADWQQWQFQSKKWALIKEGKPLSAPYDKGFLQSGLWAYSRHPNYFAEQMIWISFYLFSISAGGSFINWSILGCMLLVLLFQGSANFSEEISAGKYPAYKDYQGKVSRFLPFGG